MLLFTVAHNFFAAALLFKKRQGRQRIAGRHGTAVGAHLRVVASVLMVDFGAADVAANASN